jgi:hypothetical protein
MYAVFFLIICLNMYCLPLEIKLSRGLCEGWEPIKHPCLNPGAVFTIVYVIFFFMFNELR